MFEVEVICKRSRRGTLLNIGLNVNKRYKTIIKINPFNCFTKFIASPTALSLDVLYFTSIIYSIDKLIPRKDADDNWTRDIKVSIPVSDADLWMPAVPNLKLALDFLTGDNWLLSFTKLKRQYYRKTKSTLPIVANFDHVCLFSGGLDSLAGSIDLIHKKDNVLLISHNDSTGASSKIQKPLINKIKAEYSSKNIDQSSFHIFADASNESTTRGRSILFHGLALFHAINLNLDRIIAPENGVISINLPLTPSRTCSNSTKTMHPYFLDNLQQALILVGVNIQIINPYLYKTKGEMLLESYNKELIAELAPKTLSCSHGGGHTNGWVRNSYNCGYCIPCTIRRASIHAFSNSLDKGEDYGHDIKHDEVSFITVNDKKLDLLALSYFLNKNLQVNEIKREVKLMANIDHADEIAKMLVRGYAEIKQYIYDKASESTKRLFTCQLK